MSHQFVKREPTCEICGLSELDHYWKCEKHSSAGNGAFNCFYCLREDVDEQLK